MASPRSRGCRRRLQSSTPVSDSAAFLVFALFSADTHFTRVNTEGCEGENGEKKKKRTMLSGNTDCLRNGELAYGQLKIFFRCLCISKMSVYDYLGKVKKTKLLLS